MNFTTAAEHDPLIAEVMVGAEELRGRVVELGAEISRDYAERYRSLPYVAALDETKLPEPID